MTRFFRRGFPWKTPMTLGILLLCFFAHAHAQTTSLLEPAPNLWTAAQTVQQETGGQKLPTTCLEPCAGLQNRLELEPDITGLRAIVAWLLEQAARPPPLWFFVGIVKRQAGLLPDRKAEARRRAWLLSGQFPSLLSLNLSQSAAPFVARAEFGAGFAEYLLERFGLPKLKTILRFFYANLTLSDAFLEVLGVSLEQVYADWREFSWQKLNAQRTELAATGLPSGQTISSQTDGALVWTTSKQLLAAQNAGLYRFDLDSSALELVAKLPYLPSRLSLASDGALVYARPRAYGAVSGEVFRFAGREEQLTFGANASEAAADGACLVYIRAGSSLWRWCDGAETNLWTAPKGWRVLQLATRAGNIALTVVRGNFWDIAVLQHGKFKFVTADLARDETPLWLDDETLVYSSDHLGTTQLFIVRLGQRTTTQISAAVGGAFSPSLAPNGRVGFYSFVGQGMELRLLEPSNGLPVSLGFSEPSIALTTAPTTTQSQPNLLPDFAVAFSSGVGLAASGSDGVFSYRVAGGYDLFGLGLGADAQLRFAPVQGWRLNGSGNANQKGYSILMRATWFGTGEVAAERVGVVFSPFVTLENGVLLGWLDVALGNGASDVWDYTTQNWQFFMRLNTKAQYQFSLALADAVAGGFLEIGLLASNTVLSGHMTIRGSYPLEWRFNDGVLALERLTLVGSAGVSTRETAFGLQVLLDGVLNYTALFSFGLEFGYSSRSGFVVDVLFRML